MVGFRRWQAPAAFVLLMAAACSGTPSRPAVRAAVPMQSDDVLHMGKIRRAPVRAASTPVSPAALRSFSDCDALLSYVRKNAASATGPYGLPGGGGGLFAGDAVITAPAGQPMVLGTRESASSAPAPAPSDHSTTNVQEAGIDEPDIVKSDGERALIVAGGRLRLVDVRSRSPRELGSLRLPTTGDRPKLLVAGTRALVISQDWGSSDRGVPVAWRDRLRTVVRVVEVGDPAAMRIVTTLYTEGRFVSARMVDGLMRLVVANGPSLEGFVYPQSGSKEDEARATMTNRRIVRRSTLDHWMPHFAVVDRRGPAIQRSSGRMSECGKVQHPRVFSGIEMVTVATVDPNHPGIQGAASVVGAGEIVYASSTRLYVATAAWRDGMPAATTDIHAFDISNPQGAQYIASGSVPGTVLNQYSLSEHEGLLRVATTTAGPADASVSAVYVLQQRGRILAPLGHVGGLGVGERIQAVRFIGDLAYVVTFRQIDPLYVVDLRNPARPVVRGELKIEGFSAYLHPVGDGLLLGVGQNGTSDGRLLGAQVSLFDVSDPASPKRLDSVNFEEPSWASSDPHSFLYWASTGLAVVPVSGEGHWAAGIRVRDRSLGEIPERVQHPAKDYAPPIERSFVAGDRLFTLSESGLMSSDIDSFEQRTWLPWSATE